MSKHYTANSTTKAWEIADRLFPSDYLYNGTWSVNAGYSIYRSTLYNDCWISDLGCRLELNIHGESINVWIDETAQETTTEAQETTTEAEFTADVQKMVAASNIAKEIGKTITETFTDEYHYRKVHLPVMGYKIDSETEKTLFRALMGDYWTGIAWDLVSTWVGENMQCNEWIGSDLERMQYGTVESGHVVITAYIGTK